MIDFLTLIFVSLFMQVQQFFTAMDPAYLDLIKIFTGCIGWIGGLTLFVWWKERHKTARVMA